MTFIKYYLKYLSFLLVLGALFGRASIILAAFVFMIVGTICKEYSKFKSPTGKQEIQKEQNQERAIEEYWGTIDYNNK